MAANGKTERNTDEQSILIHLRSFVTLVTLFLSPQSHCAVGKEASEHYTSNTIFLVMRAEYGFKGWTGNVIVINNTIFMGKFLDSF